MVKALQQGDASIYEEAQLEKDQLDHLKEFCMETVMAANQRLLLINQVHKQNIFPYML
jgi:hypothetical protein